MGVLDGYMKALYARTPKAVPPLAKDVRMTENTGEIEVGEGEAFPFVTLPYGLGNGWTPGSGR